MPTEYVHLIGNNNPDWTAIAGIAGTLAGGLVGGWLGDRRRLTSDRRLRSADDLVKVIDEVAVSLQALAQAAGEMRLVALRWGPDEERVGPRAEATEDAWQSAQATIARLAMRPHASKELVDKATAAANAFIAAWRLVLMAMSISPLQGKQPAMEPIGQVAEKVDEGYNHQREYGHAARNAIEKLLGAPPSRRR